MVISLLSYRWLRKLAKQQFGALLTPLLSQQPAAQLIRRTAREQWRLLALNLGSSVVEAFTEGATLAVIFMAVESLTAPQDQLFSSSRLRLIGSWLPVIGWLNSLPTTSLFLGLLALAVLLQALQSLTRYLNQMSVGYFAARCVAKVTALIHQQVLSFSFPCASGYKVGDLTNHAANGPVAVQAQVEYTGALGVSLLMIATYLAVLARISPWLLLSVLLLGGLISALQNVLLPRIRAESARVMHRQVEISSRITEDFQGLRLLHSNGQLDQADRHLRDQMGGLEQALRSRSRLLAVLTPFSAFLPILAIAVIAGLSLLLFQSRNAGVMPNLVTFVLALQRLNQRLSNVANIFSNLADNSSRIDRLNEILSTNGKQFRSLGGVAFECLRSEVRFEAVGLRYAKELEPALSDVSFILPKGQTLALVGPSGAGKSSIADLLIGLYAPSEGRIWIDDMPLDQLELASWQQKLGVVSQDTFLFNASLAENIAYGTAGATREAVEAAASAAHADGFIQSLPNGYDTLVGERGYRLSGGQRQRISLARAILRQPELLILDEATSALDTQSERLVQEAIESMGNDKTILVVAHRLSTISRADQILVLKSGSIMQRGVHNTLLKENGLYADLCNEQLTGMRVPQKIRYH